MLTRRGPRDSTNCWWPGGFWVTRWKVAVAPSSEVERAGKMWTRRSVGRSDHLKKSTFAQEWVFQYQCKYKTAEFASNQCRYKTAEESQTNSNTMKRSMKPSEILPKKPAFSSIYKHASIFRCNDETFVVKHSGKIWSMPLRNIWSSLKAHCNWNVPNLNVIWGWNASCCWFQHFSDFSTSPSQ